MALPDYLEDTAKDFAKQSVATYSAPIETSTFTGGLDASGVRAAGPGITGANPFVAQMDPLQTQAQSLAQAGIGSYSPFLQAAQANISSQAGLTGPQAFQNFMSPYQQQVIDTTLSEYDKQSQAGAQQIRDAAVGSGNFGGGREGAMLGEYDARTLADRSALQAQMLQSGFQNAQQAAANAFTQGGQLAAAQSGLGAAQMGLSNFQRAGLGADVGALGQLGSLRQGLTQAQLQADQEAARTAAYEPYGRLQQYGQGLTGLAGGVASAYAEPAPVQSPLSQALSTALDILLKTCCLFS